MYLLLLVLYFYSTLCSHDPSQTTWLTSLLSDYHHHQIDIHESSANNTSTSTYDLSSDLWTLIIGHLHRSDIRSLLRSSHHNMHCCKHFIRNLLGMKLSYLLSHKSSDIQMNHLLNIPLVSSISMHASDMPNYFKSGHGQSMFLGIDCATGNGFISFWMKQIAVIDPGYFIISILFNETGIHCLYLSKSMYPMSLLYPVQMHQINTSSNSRDMKTISTILLKGMITDNYATWCLTAKWESCMFWPKIKDTINDSWIICLPLTISCFTVIILMVLLMMHTTWLCFTKI